jgi:hypothetical protein
MSAAPFEHGGGNFGLCVHVYPGWHALSLRRAWRTHADLTPFEDSGRATRITRAHNGSNPYVHQNLRAEYSREKPIAIRSHSHESAYLPDKALLRSSFILHPSSFRPHLDHTHVNR